MEQRASSWLGRLMADLGQLINGGPARAPGGEAARPAPESGAAPGRQRPKEYDTYLMIMQRAFQKKAQRMRERLASLEEYREARRDWDLTDPKGNDAIVHALVPRLNELLREVFDFQPARIVVTEAMRADLYGVYHAQKRIIHVRKALYQKPLRYFLHTYLHEQMHVLQNDMILYYEAGAAGRFGNDEMFMIRYWVAQGATRFDPTPYEETGMEVHAEFVADEVLD